MMEKGERPNVADAARDTRRRAAFLLKKPRIEQAEVYETAKEFFKAYLKKRVEFTTHELKREIHKVYLNSAVRNRVDALIDKLSLMEYTDLQYSQAELKMIVEDLDGIIKDLFIEHQRAIPPLTRLANWLFRKTPKRSVTVISEYPMTEPQDKVWVELNTLLEDIYASLDEGKVRRAMRLYHTLLKRYDRLGHTVQHRLYHKVHAAYREILKHPPHSE